MVFSHNKIKSYPFFKIARLVSGKVKLTIFMRKTRIAKFLFACKIEGATVALYFYDTYDRVVFLNKPLSAGFMFP
jgi:hypothetical protein